VILAVSEGEAVSVEVGVLRQARNSEVSQEHEEFPSFRELNRLDRGNVEGVAEGLPQPDGPIIMPLRSRPLVSTA
jgi:hypothetical protein